MLVFGIANGHPASIVQQALGFLKCFLSNQRGDWYINRLILVAGDVVLDIALIVRWVTKDSVDGGIVPLAIPLLFSNTHLFWLHPASALLWCRRSLQSPRQLAQAQSLCHMQIGYLLDNRRFVFIFFINK